MADYWGVHAIAARMSINRSSLRRWLLNDAFPMYRRRPNRTGARTTWYTNDALIQAWQLARCAADRRRVLATRQRTPA